MAGEFILHQLFSEIEKEYKFIQERPYKVLEKTSNRHSTQGSRAQAQSPTGRAELSCERNDMKTPR